MTKQIWHKGPPPHVGWWNASLFRESGIWRWWNASLFRESGIWRWWNASLFRESGIWRWWNGKCWSVNAIECFMATQAAHFAKRNSSFGFENYSIEWTYYYPKNARVPRINPEVKP
jgi:hypothetical protein